MKIQRTHLIGSLLLAFVVASGCASDGPETSPQIVGSWQSADETMSFNDDGTFVLDSSVQTTGTYSIVGDYITLVPDPELQSPSVSFSFYLNEDVFAIEALLAQADVAGFVGVWLGGTAVPKGQLDFRLDLRADGTGSYTVSGSEGELWVTDTTYSVDGTVMNFDALESMHILDNNALSARVFTRAP